MSEFDNAKKAYQRFSSNAIISVDYARALLNVKKPKECIDVLKATLILPQEGAGEGQEIFVMANIELALNNIEHKKYKEAITYLDKAKQFPENLGSGMPDDPDYRFQDYLLGYCAKKSGDEQKSLQYYRNIIDYSSDIEKFYSTGNATDNYISVLILNKYGKGKQSAELMNGWIHFQDSLSAWHISNKRMSSQMKWVLAKYYGRTADAKAFENKIVGLGNESRFSLFLRALELVEEKRKSNE